MLDDSYCFRLNYPKLTLDRTMKKLPRLRPPSGWSARVDNLGDPAEEVRLQDLQTLKEIVEGLDRLEETLNSSPIPRAVTQRGYFAPDEDDRVRQGVLAYRNYRLAAYEIILRYRDYATVELPSCRLRCF